MSDLPKPLKCLILAICFLFISLCVSATFGLYWKNLKTIERIEQRDSERKAKR